MSAEHGQNLGQVRKTRRMLAVESRLAQPGEEIGDILLRMYVDEDKPLAQISREFNSAEGIRVSYFAISDWMKRLHPEIAIRSYIPPPRKVREMWQDPKKRDSIISGMKAAWQDPEKRARQLGSRSTPEHKALRRKVALARWEDYPEQREAFVRASLEAVKARSAQLRAPLGDHPQEALGKMLVDESLSRVEVAKKLRVSRKFVGSLIVKFGLQVPRRRNSLSIDEINKRRAKIQKAIESGVFGLLTSRQQEALLALYPAQGVAPTQLKVADDLHLTRERIRQHDKKGLAELDRLLEVGPGN